MLDSPNGKFLSTLSLRRATWRSSKTGRHFLYFYPRSPCGERPVAGSCRNGVIGFLSTLSLRRATVTGFDSGTMVPAISIHALLAESDYTTWLPAARQNVFLSTLSLRRATYLVRGQRPSLGISIHALLAESDVHYDNYNLHCVEISIHALLAESDPRGRFRLSFYAKFLSTLSLRRATRIIDIINDVIDNFYPRSPCGERLASRLTDMSTA